MKTQPKEYVLKRIRLHFSTAKTLVTASLSLLALASAQAADHYVRPWASSPSHTGSNWNNAWSMEELNQYLNDATPSGETIWLAAGNYNTYLMVRKRECPQRS